jgi:hypothetical protein
MVRTKVARKGGARKHPRTSTDSKQAMEDQLREMESYGRLKYGICIEYFSVIHPFTLSASTFETDLELKYRESCDELHNLINKIKCRIPKSVLQKTIGEIQDCVSTMRSFVECTILDYTTNSRVAKLLLKFPI